VDHIIYGWIFFAVVMALLLVVGGWWREKPDQHGDVTASPATNVNETERRKPERQRSAGATVAFACCSLVAVGLAPVSIKIFWTPPGQSPRFELIAPVVSLPVQSTGIDVINWKPNILMPNAELAQSYEIETQPIELYIAYYAPEQPDAKLVSSTNALFDRTLWTRTREDDVEVNVEGQRLRAHETLVRSPQRSLVIWSWYWVYGKHTSSDTLAKLLLVKARFL